MYKITILVEGVEVSQEEKPDVYIPIKDATDSAGNPVQAFFRKREFPTQYLEVPGTKISLDEFNKRWLEHHNVYWGISREHRKPYLQIDGKFSSQNAMDAFLYDVNKILSDTFGGDLDELYHQLLVRLQH